jgi:hypothetical protein
VQIRLPPRSIARNRLQCERVSVGPRLFDEVYAPSTLGIFLREFSFGVLMLVVMTTTARAALLPTVFARRLSRWSAAKVLHFAGSAE